MQAFYAGILAILAAALLSTASFGQGIQNIRATSDKLQIVAAAPDGRDVAIVELRPFDPHAGRHTGQRVWQGEIGADAVIIDRLDGPRDRLYSKFQLVESATGKPIGHPHWVDDLSALPTRDFEFPWPESIKGLQVQMVEDAIALGVKYAGMNIMVPSLFDWSGDDPDETWSVDGEVIPINADYVASIDSKVKTLTDAGINVTAILLNGVPDEPDPNNPLIHPNTDLDDAPFSLGAFNTTDERGIIYLRAAVEYLANRYSDPQAEHGWISGYIIGNEVQAHWEWYNIGRMALTEFVKHYGIALRIADLAARRYHSRIRTYVSLEHHWNVPIRPDPLTAFRGKEFLEHLNAWAKRGGDFPWHVAFHPYPENLFQPRTWQDRQVALSFDTPKITFKNVEVLPAFLRQPGFRFGGEPRRVLLSEQGFHTPGGADGEKIQAAGYAYAYHRIRNTAGIDAFILHRHVDYKTEGGLRLGLWTWDDDVPAPAKPSRKKHIYEVFRLADTDQWREAFAFAKPIIGIESWDDVLPDNDIERTPDLTPSLTIAADGASEYRIVIPDDADPVSQYAAGELQHFLDEVSGANLAIVEESEFDQEPGIYIGPTKRGRQCIPDESLHELAEDGVAIRTNGPDIILRGQDARGRLYSVYVLLERFLGVRFLARDCTIVRPRNVLTLPDIDYQYASPFMYRETLYFDSFPREIAARQRLNGPNIRADEQTGGKIEFFPYVHSLCRLVPPDEYFDDHPEYFSLIDGERVGAKIHSQLCLTNPDVLQIAKTRVMQWIEEHPDVPIFDVSQNDGGGACQCDECQAIVEEEGSEAGPILRFVNAIADAVAKNHPDKWIETLAYSYSVKPPQKTTPRDNVIIRLCHAGCYFHGFEECGLGAGFAGNINAWTELTDRVFIWHYATNFAHYLAPNQNLVGLVRDLKYYGDHDVNGVMVQANYQGPGGELAELRQYLASQLMWNPDRDPYMIRLEFCNGYYGSAAGDVLDYLALMDKAASKPDVHAFGAWDPRDTVTPEFVSEGLAILARALSHTDSPKIQNRIKKLHLPLWYMQLSWPDRYDLDPESAPDTLAQFANVVQKNGITHVREGEANMEQWLAEMRARHGSMAEDVVYDLFLKFSDATATNCLDWRRATMEQDGETLLTLFHHPPEDGHGDATYEIDLPQVQADQRIILQFATAFSGPTTNGAKLSVLVNDQQVWSTVQSDQAAVKHEIDLSDWAGGNIALTLRVDGLGDITHDWVNWVRPQVLVENG